MEIKCRNCRNDMEFIQKETTDNPTATCSVCEQFYYAYWSVKGWVIVGNGEKWLYEENS